MSFSLSLLIVLVALPIVGAGIIAALRGARLATEKREQSVLFGMLILPLVGVLMIFAIRVLPFSPSVNAALPFGAPVSFSAADTALDEGAAVDFLSGLGTIGVGVLALGIMGCLMRLLRQHLFLSRIIRRAVWDQGILYTEENVPPFAWKDRLIIIPLTLNAALSDQELQMIVAHEQAHIRRRDGRWFSTLALLDAVFWYNPFLRRQTARCRQAAEDAVDGSILIGQPTKRKAYANSLITVLEHTAGRPLRGIAAMSANSIEDTKMRLKRIMGHSAVVCQAKRPALMALVPIFLIQGAVAASLFATAAELTVTPVKGVITSGFGKRFDPLTDEKKDHRGVDIKAKKGTPVLAAGGGVVTFAEYRGGYGKLVEIDHGKGTFTRYAQLSKIKVSVGDKITAGQKIGAVGSTGRSTGPHLHFEVIVSGEHVDPATLLAL